MTATIALARAELVMLARNRTAAVNAVLLPLGLGALWIFTDPPAGYAAFGAVLQLLMVVSFTVVITASTTLVARRQQHVLERWRTSGAATPSVLLGTLAPACVLLVLQAAILFAATAYATGTAPARPVFLALALVLGGALGAAAAFVTAAFTRTVEAVSISAVPVVAAFVAGGVWASSAAAGGVTWLMRATGGGALAEVVRVGWAGPADGDGLGAALTAVGPSLLVLLVLAVAAVLAALRTFRWRARA